jgi:hypothetical protein
MRIESIKQIKKRFRREWLLIAVDKMDEATTTPLTGRVIAHSPRKEDIYRILRKPTKPRRLLLEHSEDMFPKNWAAAF